MNIEPLHEKSPGISRAYQLFMDAVSDHEMLHEEMNLSEFLTCIFPNKKEIKVINLLESNGKGFACGCVDQKNGKSFITMIIVDKKERGKGIGRELLIELEKQLVLLSGKTIIEISFYNPITFSWKIQRGKNFIKHPNTPGIDVSTSAYLFFKNCAYQDFAMQNSYYSHLSKYEYPIKVDQKKYELEKENIMFGIYDETIHLGISKFIGAFKNPMWERDILGEPSIHEGGRPILCAIFQNRIIGFAGPLDVERSGRGYFAGIAVDNDFQGKGIAKVLFCDMCLSLRKLGANYMTLFTGETNYARYIYEAAGFSIVRTWSDMRKNCK